MDNKTEQAYAAWPDRLYIVGADGTIAYKGGIGPAGFKAAEMGAALEKLLARSSTKPSSSTKPAAAAPRK